MITIVILLNDKLSFLKWNSCNNVNHLLQNLVVSLSTCSITDEKLFTLFKICFPKDRLCTLISVLTLSAIGDLTLLEAITGAIRSVVSRLGHAKSTTVSCEIGGWSFWSR